MKPLKVILLSWLFLMFILLLSYKINLAFSDKTINQRQTIDYLQGQGALNLNYTESETMHLQDVKEVMQNADYLFYLSLIGILIFIYPHYQNKIELAKLIKLGGIISLAILGILLLLISISFSGSFTIFHQLFFPQGNWQFPADSLIIQTFPLEFFINLGWKIFVTALLIIGFILLLIRKSSIQRN